MQKTDRRHPIIKALLITLLIFILLVGGAIGYLFTPSFGRMASGWAADASGRKIAVEGGLHMAWVHGPRFTVRGLSVANADWSSEPVMFSADTIEFTVRLRDLLRLRLTLPELNIKSPKLVLEKNEKGDSNWSMTQNAAAAAKAPVPDNRFEVPVIGRLHIDDGTLKFRDPAKHIATELNISTARGKADVDEMIVLNGKGDYQNKPFLLHVSGGSILSLRESSKPYPFSMKTTIGDTKASMEGTVQDPIQMKDFDITLDLAGANAADLFPITGIALPPTPPYRLKGRLLREGENWHFVDFSGTMGTSDLAGDIKWYSERKPPFFDGSFVSNNLDVKDLKGLIGAQDKPEDPNRVIPDNPIDISRLTAMDADVKFKGRHITTSQVLDDFSMTVELRNGTLVLKPVTFGVAKGHISANVTIEGRKNPPIATADVQFSQLSLYHLFEPLVKRYGQENVSIGMLGGRAALVGTGKSLRTILATSNGEIGVGMEGGTLSRLLLELVGLDIFKSAGLILSGQDKPVPIRCVVGDFMVKDGVMNTREFLIDTKVTTIRGKGTVDLKNENLDLKMHVYPKDATLISARSPLLLKGTLKHPAVGVDATALAVRGGIAAALGALLTPVGALLAFIEPGLGEKSDCAAFIHELESKTGQEVPKNPTPAQ